MTRGLAWLVLVAGLTLGSVIDSGDVVRPVLAEGRILITADLHVHAFPGDGMLPAWELRKEARRRGLDVIAITNHNHSIAARLPAGGDGGALPLVIPGQEITTPGFHMVAVGVRHIVDWRLPLREAIEAVHAQGGVAIAAHPVKESWRVGDEDALAGLDGAEAVHAFAQTHSRGRFQLRQFFENARRRNPSLAAIGASDFHSSAPIGRCLTYIAVDDVTERGVLDAIRRGRTAASDNRGTFIGDPAVIKLAQQTRLSEPGGEASGALRKLSVVMVVAAMLALVCFRN
jgi:predicted metal-dependent phosphoesterase TrpH